MSRFLNPAWFYGLIFAVGLLWAISEAHSFWDGVGHVFAFAYLAPFGAALLLILLAPFYLVFEYFFGARFKKYQEENRKCPHGLRGGQTRKLCGPCREAAEVALVASQKAEAERVRRDRLRQAAEVRLNEERRRWLNASLAQVEYLKGLTPKQFEDEICRVYERFGFVVTQTPYSNDGGKDAIMKKDGRVFLLECKRYGAKTQVGRPDLQKFWAAMAEAGAFAGYFVTTGRFSKAAVEYGQKNNIFLIDEEALPELVEEAYPEKFTNEVRLLCADCGVEVVFSTSNPMDTKPCPRGHTVRNLLSKDNLVVARGREACPKCGRPMRLKSGRYGTFMGCTGFRFGCSYTKKAA